MKQVELISFKDLFQPQNLEDIPQLNRLTSLALRYLSFSPIKLHLFIFGFCLIGSPFSRDLFILMLSLGIFYSYLYLKYKAMADKIELYRRELPNHIVQNSEFSLYYKIKNLSSFKINNFIIEDYLGLQKDPHHKNILFHEITPHSQKSIKLTLKCDSHIGIQNMGPYAVQISDPLGIFQFRIKFDEVKKINLLPNIKNHPQVHFSPTPNQMTYGIYDTITRGTNVNFNGLREFQIGDSLRHIAWRASAKHNEILVKEYERSVNSFVTIILDLDANNHIHTDSISSWDLCIEAALDIIQQQAAHGNTVQIISQHVHLQPGVGSQFVEHCSKNLLNEDFFATETNVSVNQILNSYYDNIPASSSVVIISPFIFREHIDAKTTLYQYLQKDIKISCVFINLNSYLTYLRQYTSWATLPVALASQNLNQFIDDLNAYDIQTIFLNREDHSNKLFHGLKNG